MKHLPNILTMMRILLIPFFIYYFINESLMVAFAIFMVAYLAIPVMFGASLLKLLDFGFSFTFTELSMLLLGMVVAFAVSIFVIKFLLSYIKKHDFTAFGWYRIVLGVLVLLYFGLK